jgi:xylulokinase
VELLAAEEGGAFGAALLAGVGVGAWPTVEAACAATVKVADVIEPKNAATMDEAYAKFRRVYPALREIGRT